MVLGSNKSTEERLKLFPRTGESVVNKVQNKLFERTGKKIEVMVYGDGAFKDPVGHIWELADPVVSPAYTSGLEGTPNEIKLKYISDNKFSNLSGEDLKNAIKEEVRKKDNDLTGNMLSQGTTPRKYTDLIGSLCDLTSGSGDKGTPVVFIQGYFDNITNEWFMKKIILIIIAVLLCGCSSQFLNETELNKIIKNDNYCMLKIL